MARLWLLLSGRKVKSRLLVGLVLEIHFHSKLSFSNLSSDVYKMRGELHVGVGKKPLEPYHPNAYRSRLYQPQITMPYKNSSQIVIGDRS